MCDVVVAVGTATGRGTIWAKNSDRPPSEMQVLEWYPPRADVGTVRATYIEVDAWPGETLGVVGTRPVWGWGLEQGVNTAGVAAGNLAVFTTLDPRGRPPALTGMDLVRLALQRGTSAARAVEVIVGAIERYGQGGSGQEAPDRPYWSSFVVADPSAAWVVDTSGPVFDVMQVERSQAASNRPVIGSFDAAHRHPGQPVERLVDPRLARSREFLAREPVTSAGAIDHLRDHASLPDGSGHGGYSLCMHVPGVEATTASLVADLTPDGPPLVWCSLGSPCGSAFVPIRVGPVGRRSPSGGRVLSEPMPPGGRAALDATEASLRALVTREPSVLDDPCWPDDAWGRVAAAARR